MSELFWIVVAAFIAFVVGSWYFDFFYEPPKLHPWCSFGHTEGETTRITSAGQTETCVGCLLRLPKTRELAKMAKEIVLLSQRQVRPVRDVLQEHGVNLEDRDSQEEIERHTR